MEELCSTSALIINNNEFEWSNRRAKAMSKLGLHGATSSNRNTPRSGGGTIVKLNQPSPGSDESRMEFKRSCECGEANQQDAGDSPPKLGVELLG